MLVPEELFGVVAHSDTADEGRVMLLGQVSPQSSLAKFGTHVC